MRHRLVGYDPVSEKLEVSRNIPEPIARLLVTFEPDDPDGCDVYKVEGAIASALLRMPLLVLLMLWRRGAETALLQSLAGLPGGLDYFVEPSDPSFPFHPWARHEDGDSAVSGGSRSRN